MATSDRGCAVQFSHMHSEIRIARIKNVLLTDLGLCFYIFGRGAGCASSRLVHGFQIPSERLSQPLAPKDSFHSRLRCQIQFQMLADQP